MGMSVRLVIMTRKLGYCLNVCARANKFGQNESSVQVTSAHFSKFHLLGSPLTDVEVLVTFRSDYEYEI